MMSNATWSLLQNLVIIKFGYYILGSYHTYYSGNVNGLYSNVQKVTIILNGSGLQCYTLANPTRYNYLKKMNSLTFCYHPLLHEFQHWKVITLRKKMNMSALSYGFVSRSWASIRNVFFSVTLITCEMPQQCDI